MLKGDGWLATHGRLLLGSIYDTRVLVWLQTKVLVFSVANISSAYPSVPINHCRAYDELNNNGQNVIHPVSTQSLSPILRAVPGVYCQACYSTSEHTSY